jgi:hypothetical protein
VRRRSCGRHGWKPSQVQWAETIRAQMGSSQVPAPNATIRARMAKSRTRGEGLWGKLRIVLFQSVNELDAVIGTWGVGPRLPLQSGPAGIWCGRRARQDQVVGGVPPPPAAAPSCAPYLIVRTRSRNDQFEWWPVMDIGDLAAAGFRELPASSARFALLSRARHRRQRNGQGCEPPTR